MPGLHRHREYSQELHIAVSDAREQLVDEVAKHLHAGDRFAAARLIASFTGQDPKKVVTTEDKSLEFCFSLLQWCLDNDHYDWAARMLWGEHLFTYKPRCTQMVWRALQTKQAILLQGSASMSKSYGGGVWHLLDWVRDPVYTNILLVGPSEDHLKGNLFSHLVTLHQSSTLPLPGIIGDLFIGLDPRARRSAIRGVVIPLGKRPAGRLQGTKRYPRKTAHPIFGRMSRVRIFMDEFEKIPVGVHKDIDNVFSNLDGDVEGFKITGAYNPEDISGQVAQRAEPPGGWGEDSFKPDRDEEWVSKRGWFVVRLDAAKSENVVQKKKVFEGLQTVEGFNKIIQNAGGLDTPGYWTMCRGCFPRSGAIYTIMSALSVSQMKGEFIFVEAATDCGGVDLALEGGDAAEFCHGKYGRASGYKSPPSLDNPQGKTVMFEDKHGQRCFRFAVQLIEIFPLANGDTVKMAEQVRTHAVRLHVAPKDLMLDRTGNGAGVHDLLKALWSQEIRGVNYSESASETKILEEDTKTAKEEYERAVGELWFAFKKFCNFGFLRAKAEALTESLVLQLTGRRYAPGKQTKVEEKPEYKARGNSSPNEADSATLMVMAARKGSGVIPSAANENAGNVSGGSGNDRPVEHRVARIDKYDDLDSGGTGDLPDGFEW